MGKSQNRSKAIDFPSSLMATRVARATSWFRGSRKKQTSLTNLFVRQESSNNNMTEAWINFPASTEPFGIVLRAEGPPSIKALNGRAADSCELMVGDIIVGINGMPPDSAEHATQLLTSFCGSAVRLQIRRAQQRRVKLEKPNPSMKIGIVLRNDRDCQRHPLRIAELMADGIARATARLVVGAAVTVDNGDERTVDVFDALTATTLIKKAAGKVTLH